MLNSCTKKDDADALFFRVKVDGKLVEATGINAYAVQDDDEYNIYGVFSGKSSMYIQLAKDKGVGTHQITENPNFALYADETETGHRSDQNGASGEVTITEKSAEVVKGTFKCTRQLILEKVLKMKPVDRVDKISQPMYQIGG